MSNEVENQNSQVPVDPTKVPGNYVVFAVFDGVPHVLGTIINGTVSIGTTDNIKGFIKADTTSNSHILMNK